MTTITTRAGKGSPLTNGEMDTNLDNLNTYKVEQTSSTGSAVIPAGTEAERPGSPAQGYVRFNTDSDKFEGWNGTSWGPLGADTAISINEVAATSDGQTSYTVSYNVGSSQFYFNGVLLNNADITATSGTSVTLANGTGVVIGHRLKVVSFTTIGLAGALPLTGGTITGNVNVIGTLSVDGQKQSSVATATALAIALS